MDCEDYREALSARLDGEASPVAEERLEAHLAECAGCRSWQQRAIALNRTLRVRPAQPTPDLTAAVLRAAPARTGRGWRRIALAVVGGCQLVLGFAQLAGVGQDNLVAMAGHLFNESTAWNLAIGLGLLWTAWRPGAAAGTVPVLSAFVLVLTGFCVHDLVLGTATAGRVATHGLLVAGLIALVLVQRDQRPPRRTGSGTPEEPADPAGTASPSPQVRPGDLGPTAYRRTG
ncbi:zf-HC2 domain-containing protein [Saccharopolyspora halophila]|uniref:zf-HC2 domain-containing protein n=1 Tax=Saccharopolyspora halophila TaxID=405551 RepID=UPI0031E2C0B5